MILYFSGTGNSLAIARKIAEAIDDQVLPLTDAVQQDLANFYPADEFHQDYLDKHPDGYCHLPKALFEFARNQSNAARAEGCKR